jgi:hypothetical protein
MATMWKPLLLKPRVVGQGHAEVAGADDDDVAGAVDAERLARDALQPETS